MDHEATVPKGQAHDFKQDAGLIRTDGQDTSRVVLGIQIDNHERMTKRMFDGFALDAMLEGSRVDWHSLKLNENM